MWTQPKRFKLIQNLIMNLKDIIHHVNASVTWNGLGFNLFLFQIKANVIITWCASSFLIWHLLKTTISELFTDSESVHNFLRYLILKSGSKILMYAFHVNSRNRFICISRQEINCCECSLYMFHLSTFLSNVLGMFGWGRLSCKSLNYKFYLICVSNCHCF